MAKFTCEVVKEFDGTYYANLILNGELVKGLPEYVSYKELAQAIKEKTGIVILKCKDMIFERCGRKYYAFIDATQSRNDCRVKLEERLNGYKPNFN